MNKSTKIFIPLFLIFVYLTYPEIRREYLFQKYLPSEHQVRALSMAGNFPISSIMQAGEVKVCSMNSYSRPDELTDLTEKQKQSLSKSETPSEDGSWYLLFYSIDKINRVILIRNIKPPILLEAQNCGAANSFFSISEKMDPSSIAIKFFQITER
jgi:hypothetical protein